MLTFCVTEIKFMIWLINNSFNSSGYLINFTSFTPLRFAVFAFRSLFIKQTIFSYGYGQGYPVFILHNFGYDSQPKFAKSLSYKSLLTYLVCTSYNIYIENHSIVFIWIKSTTNPSRFFFIKYHEKIGHLGISVTNQNNFGRNLSTCNALN